MAAKFDPGVHVNEIVSLARQALQGQVTLSLGKEVLWEAGCVLDYFDGANVVAAVEGTGPDGSIPEGLVSFGAIAIPDDFGDEALRGKAVASLSTRTMLDAVEKMMADQQGGSLAAVSPIFLTLLMEIVRRVIDLVMRRFSQGLVMGGADSIDLSAFSRGNSNGSSSDAGSAEVLTEQNDPLDPSALRPSAASRVAAGSPSRPEDTRRTSGSTAPSPSSGAMSKASTHAPGVSRSNTGTRSTPPSGQSPQRTVSPPQSSDQPVSNPPATFVSGDAARGVAASALTPQTPAGYMAGGQPLAPNQVEELRRKDLGPVNNEVREASENAAAQQNDIRAPQGSGQERLDELAEKQPPQVNPSLTGENPVENR